MKRVQFFTVLLLKIGQRIKVKGLNDKRAETFFPLFLFSVPRLEKFILHGKKIKWILLLTQEHGVRFQDLCRGLCTDCINCTFHSPAAVASVLSGLF